MSVNWVPLGAVLNTRPSEAIESNGSYRIAGVYGFGRGVLRREAISGHETNYKRLTRLTVGDVIYSKLKAFEGAVAVVDPESDGYFVSPEFPVFEVVAGVNTAYLGQYLRSTAFSESLAAKSSGIGARRERVHPTDFLSIPIPLPPRAEQDRIANYLNSIERSIQGTHASQPLAHAAHARAERQWLERFPHARLGDVAVVNPGRTRVVPDQQVAFVPMSAVCAESGQIAEVDYRATQEIRGGYRQFSRGDILFARITPSMQNGKSAVFNDDTVEVGYGSTEFHVVRANDSRYTPWIWSILRTRWFRELAKQSFAGTAGQQRVPSSFLEQVEIPMPPKTAVDVSYAQVVRAQELQAAVAATARRRDALRASILPAARNEIFASMQ